MSVTDSAKSTAIWTTSQVRRILIGQAIMGLFIAALAGYGSYFYAAYKDMGVRVENSLPPLVETRDSWGKFSQDLFRASNLNISEKATLPTRTDLAVLDQKIVELTSALSSFPTPTGDIEETTSQFRARLFEISRSIGAYDGSAEAATRIVVRSQEAAIAGEKQRVAIENYLGSTFDRFIGAF